MKYLKWSEQYSVGIDSVDFEHRNLIDMINMIYAELEDRRNIDEIMQTMRDVHTEISAHFATEERMMLQADFGEYAAHKSDHEDLLDQIGIMMGAIENGPEPALEMLNQQLDDWFSVHFATFDVRLHGKLGH